MSEHITTDDMRAFLVAIAPGVNGAPDGEGMDEAIDLRAMAAAVACEHLPAAALDRRAIGDALRTFEVWPSAAAIYKFLSARHRVARQEIPAPHAVRPGNPHAPDLAPPRAGVAPEGPPRSPQGPRRPDGQGSV